MRTTIAVQRYLDELALHEGASDNPVIRALLARSVNRLQLLCRHLLHRSYPRLTKAPACLETDELLSAVVERLIKALREVKPDNARQFFALAQRHIRWELNDLARRIDRQERVLPLGTLDPAARVAPTDTGESATLIEILGAIEALPDGEREVFECVRIQGMTHAETAELLGVAEKTIQRRLRQSVLRLSDSLRGLSPHAIEGTDALEDDV